MTPDRDAMMLAASERPFTRWRELSGQEQEKFKLKARRLREHLKQYEPLCRSDAP